MHVRREEEVCEVFWEWSELQAVTTKLLTEETIKFYNTIPL